MPAGAGRRPASGCARRARRSGGRGSRCRPRRGRRSGAKLTAGRGGGRRTASGVRTKTSVSAAASGSAGAIETSNWPGAYSGWNCSTSTPGRLERRDQVEQEPVQERERARCCSRGRCGPGAPSASSSVASISKVAPQLDARPTAPPRPPAAGRVRWQAGSGSSSWRHLVDRRPRPARRGRQRPGRRRGRGSGACRRSGCRTAARRRTGRRCRPRPRCTAMPTPLRPPARAGASGTAFTRVMPPLSTIVIASARTDGRLEAAREADASAGGSSGPRPARAAGGRSRPARRRRSAAPGAVQLPPLDRRSRARARAPRGRAGPRARPPPARWPRRSRRSPSPAARCRAAISSRLSIARLAHGVVSDVSR